MHTVPHYDYVALTKCMAASNGQFFGGFVRNLTAGRLECKDIDIWFTTEQHKDKFLNDMKDTFTTNFIFPFVDDTPAFLNDYAHQRYIGIWQPSNYVPSDEFSAIKIDMVVSPTFVNDHFTVNSLSYDGATYTCHDSRFTVADIKEQIEKKRGYFYEDFVNIIKGTEFEPRYYERLQQMKIRGYRFESINEIQVEPEIKYNYVDERKSY